ncbi:CDP-diacylglycerol--serine O-phosphatidyltransferase [Heyndrickxia coagulans]|uniref:CDP-diacylglycerol--serine O-phosphatidyltransferase n=1 Tax=Heyndrickxia coagulans TaxID=1398 RepID=UPI00215C7F13|nr:CDP-diacylglycerol--serine O-phosphatidyltransferase [Heyndrickxia coagulans]
MRQSPAGGFRSLIFAAVLFDRYDGKLARKLKTESALGKQLDSLCDLLSFGAAPAMLIHTALFCLYGIPGMLAAMFYMLCGMIRLARFNISKQKGFFYGLPIPVAGLCVTAGFFAVPYVTHFWLFVWMVLLSVLMVAPFKLKKYEKGALQILQCAFFIIRRFVPFFFLSQAGKIHGTFS